METPKDSERTAPKRKKRAPRTDAAELAMPFLLYFSERYRSGGPGTDEMDRTIDNALNAGFRDLQLDVTTTDASDEDYFILAHFLATVIYGPKGKGAPKVWKEARLRMLETEFRQLKNSKPKLSDLECFQELVESGRFKDFGTRRNSPTAGALQRQYQLAKQKKII